LSQLIVVSRTDTGQVRTQNEDSSCAFEPEDAKVRAAKGSLYIVADGMGGHRGGEVASKLAVDTIRSEYYSPQEADPLNALAAAFRKANRIIFDKSTGDQAFFGMGTTCTAMVIVKDTAYFAHVGDSRAYLYRLDDDTIQSVLAKKKPAGACKHLIALANQHGGTDNITVQIIEVKKK